MTVQCFHLKLGVGISWKPIVESWKTPRERNFGEAYGSGIPARVNRGKNRGKLKFSESLLLWR